MFIDLSIIIVNYKSAGLLTNCLQSVIAKTNGINYEIIVVDNDSGDDSEISIRSLYPSVRWIGMGYNAGFARANNEGIKQSNGACVLLLNADTLVTDNAIGQCFQDFVRSEFVACGVQLINPDGSPQIAGNFVMKGGLNYLLPLPFVGTFIKWLGEKFRVKKPNVENTDVLTVVDWINGAFLMVKKTAIGKAGLLDNDFFLYAEEAEWCSRLREHGRLCIFGQYKVIHLQGVTANAIFGSSGKGYYNLFDRKGLQIMVSNFLRIRKEFGVSWLMIQLFFYVLDVPIFVLGVALQKLFGRRVYLWEHVRGYIRNVRTLLAYIPKMVAARPHFYKVL